MAVCWLSARTFNLLPSSLCFSWCVSTSRPLGTEGLEDWHGCCGGGPAESGRVGQAFELGGAPFGVRHFQRVRSLTSKRGAGVRWGRRWAANVSVPCGSLFLSGSPERLVWRD